jgi:hypothetical protein
VLKLAVTRQTLRRRQPFAAVLTLVHNPLPLAQRFSTPSIIIQQLALAQSGGLKWVRVGNDLVAGEDMLSRLRPSLDPENIDQSKSYCVADVALAFGYSKPYLRRLIRNGRINVFCPNGHEYRITGKEVARLKELLVTEGRFPQPEEAYQRDPSKVNIIEVPEEIAREIGLLPKLPA